MPSTARSTPPEPDLSGAHVRGGRRRAARSGPDGAAARQGLCHTWLHASGTNTDAATFGALTATGSPGHGSAFGQARSWTPWPWVPLRPADARTGVVGQGCASALGEGGPTLPHHPNTGGRSLHVQNDPRGDRPAPELLAGCANR